MDFGGGELSGVFPISCSLWSLFKAIWLGQHSKLDQSYFGTCFGLSGCGISDLALVDSVIDMEYKPQSSILKANLGWWLQHLGLEKVNSPKQQHWARSAWKPKQIPQLGVKSEVQVTLALFFGPVHIFFFMRAAEGKIYDFCFDTLKIL